MSEKGKNSSNLLVLIRGVPFFNTKRFTKKNIEEAFDYVPGDGDLFVASYPKTGTHWMQYIVLQIRSRGELFPSFDDIQYKVMPYIDMVGTAALQAQPKPRIYMHHFPYDKVQKNEKSRCIYAYRHPEDTVVSYYHFINKTDPQFGLEFDHFVDWYVTGRICYGSYFEHVLSFYQRLKDGNILMVSYEKLQANKREEMLRMAKFMGEEYYQSLLDDNQLFDKIVEKTSFDYMKKNLSPTHPDVISGIQKGSRNEGKAPKFDLFRKGIVGDGKAALSETQRQKIQAAAEKVLKNTPIFDEWYPK